MDLAASGVSECWQCKQRSPACKVCSCGLCFCPKCLNSIEVQQITSFERSWSCPICRNTQKNNQQPEFKVPEDVLSVKEWRPTPYLSKEDVYNGVKQYPNETHGTIKRTIIKASPNSAFKPIRHFNLEAGTKGKLPPISMFFALAEQAHRASQRRDVERDVKLAAEKCLAPCILPSLEGVYLGTLFNSLFK
eukprot:TRINITY_DN7377_c0_g1_i6.p1 TRINITY_DN7377_c0_g1~~TRINITY_DN7377_c0_g1_i6.p1  ORF type:complete len:191 (-),score=25.59 TRINITY_DN7377_c0_g1_i6:147-719(-)